jgi:hypothetical protein
MSENEKEVGGQEAPDAPEAKKKPSYQIFQVLDRKDAPSVFLPIGAMFEHKDGQGFNLDLNAVPVKGRVVARIPRERPTKEKAGRSRDEGQER